MLLHWLSLPQENMSQRWISLPNTDMLVDTLLVNSVPFFMDSFSGYGLIKTRPHDAKKKAFRTPICNFHYIVTSFCLKNTEATYHRAMTTTFYDMLHDCLEHYVVGIVVKSKEMHNYVNNWEESLRYVGSTNSNESAKMCFGVSFGELLGFTVHRKGVDFYLTKTKII